MRLPSGRLYLDCNATTPPAEPILVALRRAEQDLFGNPSSPYREGSDAREALETARAQVAALAGCEPGEIIFVGSATEANHLAVASAAGAAGGRNRVLFSAIEHPAVFDQRGALEARGFQVEEIPVGRDGALDLERLELLLGGNVALVCVMAAHNETGVLQPLQEVGQACERHGALFHTDAVQALGKVPSPWQGAKPHYMAAAAHKLYGPKGIGALIARKCAPITPTLVGGGQEGGRRSSTEAVPLAVAFGAACELAGRTLPGMEGVRALRDGLEAELVQSFGATVFGSRASRLPNTSLFGLPGVSGAKMVIELDRAGVAVSTGSACHSGHSCGPRVLKAMGVSPGLFPSVLRVSLGCETTAEDLNDFLERLPQCARAARA